MEVAHGCTYKKVYVPMTETGFMIYRIDFNPQKKEDRDSYLQIFKDYGWDYIQDLNGFSYSTGDENDYRRKFYRFYFDYVLCFMDSAYDDLYFISS